MMITPRCFADVGIRRITISPGLLRTARRSTVSGLVPVWPQPAGRIRLYVVGGRKVSGGLTAGAGGGTVPTHSGPLRPYPHQRAKTWESDRS